MRYLIWVELRGEDFFWGSPHSGPDVPSTRLVPGQATAISVPEDYADLPKASLKTTIHKSGVTHVTTDGSGAQAIADEYVGSVTSFTEPTMFAALFTAVPEATADYTRNPRRGGRDACVLDVQPDYWGCRWYFDFLLTPAGTFNRLPDPVMMPEGFQPPVLVTPSLSKELDLILVIRGTPIGDDLNNWQPDKNLLVLATPPVVKRPR
jgi:hypothetical protein